MNQAHATRLERYRLVGFLQVFFLSILPASLALHAGELKVDINRDSKNLDTVTETGYVKWSTDTTNAAATGTAAVSRSFTTSTSEAVTVTFAQTAESAAAGPSA